MRKLRGSLGLGERLGRLGRKGCGGGLRIAYWDCCAWWRLSEGLGLEMLVLCLKAGVRDGMDCFRWLWRGVSCSGV